MTGLIIFVVVAIVVYVLTGQERSGAKAYKPDSVSRKRIKNWAESQLNDQYQEQSDKDNRRRQNTSFAKANQARITVKAARRGADRLGGMDSVRDPHDKNRHRRSDWGSRAGPGILSLRNTSILIGAGLILLWIAGSLPVQ